MLKKKEIIDLCREIADDYEDWQFLAGVFKNKSPGHTIKLVNPLWTFSPGSALMQPIAGFYCKKVEVHYKRIFGYTRGWTHCVGLDNHYEGYGPHDTRFYDLIEDRAEEKIRRLLDDGIGLLDKTYDFSSETALLSNMPKSTEQMDGVKYCLVRAFLGDLDYVRRYRDDSFKTKYPKPIEKIDKIIAYWEEQNTG